MNEHNITTDYHMHTTFSPDAHASMEAMCRQAIQLGMTEIAITEHIEWHPRGRWLFPKIEAYFQEIERCREQFASDNLVIFSGIEMGNPHHYPVEASALLTVYPFDFKIGSIHWLNNSDIHDVRTLAHRDVDEVLTEYFAEMASMAEQANIDMVAHFDRIFWPAVRLHGQIDLLPLEPLIRQTLRVMIRNGIALELNTHFVAHDPSWNDAIIAVLTWYREEGGGRVLVNSDAHRINEIGRYRDVAAHLLASSGYGSAARLKPSIVVPKVLQPS